MSRIAWTPEQRAEIWPARGMPNPESQREEIEMLSDAEKCFAEHKQWIGYDLPRKTPWYEAGRTRVDKDLLPLMDDVLAAAREKSLPSRALDVDIAAGLVGLEIVPLFAAVKYWIAKEGIAFAMKALVRCHTYTSSAHEHGYGTKGVWLVRKAAVPEYADSAWKLIRAILATSSDKDYAAAKKVAAQLRKGAPAIVSALIASAFTTEQAWADEAARAVVAEKYPHGYSMAVITVASVELGAAVAMLLDFCPPDDILYTLLAREGAAATPVIAAALAHAGNNALRKTYAKILAMIEDDQAALAFVPYISNRAVNPIAMKFYARVPEIARRVLGPIAKGKTKEAASARVALASL